MEKYNNMMRVILTAKANFADYSVEAGKADNVFHFDHHGQWASYPAPCNNDSILPAKEGRYTVCEITHIDADTFVGLLRLFGFELPEVDFAMMEKLDLNGSSVAPMFDRTRMYMVGLGTVARDLKFPRCTDERQDVTSYILEMAKFTSQELIDRGIVATEEAEESYARCLIERGYAGKVGLWSIDGNDRMDPSRPYQDNFEAVVMYRQHFKTISIYVNPKVDLAFAGKTIGDIEFAGHPKACGSPRGVEVTLVDAYRVFKEIDG